MGEPCKRLLLSCFVVLHLMTVFYMNRPGFLVQATEAALKGIDERLVWEVQYAGWWWRRYANWVGLDNRWQMFGRQSRFNWWYVIKADYGDGEPHVLPLPLQHRRSWIEHFFIDFKETKYHLNMYPQSEIREAYGHYLCKMFAQHHGRPAKAILFDMYWQHILPREEASQKGVHLHPGIYNKVINKIQCRPLPDRAN